MKAYHAGERRPGAIKLASNENPLGPSPLATHAAQTALAEAHIYPDGSLRELTAAVAAHLGVPGAALLFGNGSDEVLTIACGTYLTADHTVVVGAHTFSQYEFGARLFGAGVCVVPMPDLQLDLQAMSAAIDSRTRALFICSPNNPTGLLVAAADIRALLARVPTDVLVVVDHAYIEYSDLAEHADLTTLAVQYPNLLVLRTFSKIYGLATMRVGYGVAHPDRIAEMQRARLPFNVGGVAQAAAIAAIGDHAFVQQSLAVNRSGRPRLQSFFRSLGLETVETQGNFVCVRVPGLAADAARWLGENGVTVRALGSFGLPHHLRVTIGTPAQLDFFEARFTEYLRLTA